MDTMEQSDEELMAAYQGGDEEAMGKIFGRYQRKIFNFALRFLSQRADAEDAVADVFLNLMKSGISWRPGRESQLSAQALPEHGASVRPGAKFSTWLYTVVRNACISKLRKRGNVFSLSFSKSSEEMDGERDVPDPSSARNELHQKEIGEHIKEAVDGLPVSQKEVLILREYHDLSYEEIANITGQSLSNVKVLIFRAREQLRQTLGFLLKEVES
jgi:RNA polymerase sigma-70 factor (ECF subfamily)